jgi:hypothetical protein
MPAAKPKLFEDNGYVALTPGWPDDPEAVEEAAEHPEVFAGKSIGQIADHFETIIGGLDRKPAIIGHSAGRLLAQILAGRGLAAVSVAIDPAPFRGVLPLPISSLKSAFPVLGNPANRERAVPLTYDQFRYSFANAVSEEEAKQLYEDFAVPTPGKPLFQAAAANLNPLDRGQGRPQEPRPWAAAVYLRRAGPHRPVGDRQRLLQAAAGQPRRDRDRQDQGPRPRAGRGSLPDVDISFRPTPTTAFSSATTLAGETCVLRGGLTALHPGSGDASCVPELGVEPLPRSGAVPSFDPESATSKASDPNKSAGQRSQLG